MRRMIAALGAVAAAAGLATAQSASPRPGNIVHIDVFATDARGRTVETLTATDFDVREDGVLQTLDSARFVRAEFDKWAAVIRDAKLK